MAGEEKNIGILEKIKSVREQINKLQNKEVELTQSESETLYKLETQLSKILAIQEKRIKRSFGSKQAEYDISKAFSEQISNLNQVSKVYSRLTDFQKTSLSTSKRTNKSVQESLISDTNKKEIFESVLESVSNLQELQQKLAESGPDDLLEQNSIRDAYKAQVNAIKESIAAKLLTAEIDEAQSKYLLKIVDFQKKGLKIAEDYATVSKEQKSLAEDQIQAYKAMKNTLKGTLDTIRMTLKTPEAMIVAASTAAGKFASAMSDVNRETGMFIGSTALLSFVFDDAASTLSTMAKLSGDVEEATFGAQLSTNVLAKSIGISGQEAAELVNAFGNLQGLSGEVGRQMVANVENTARLNGVLPKQVMSDIASATEEMALYSKGTGENFAMAAIQASKLGVSVGTTTKIADNLLDFESSMTKELEASAMLGRQLNLDRARALAAEEDIAGMTKEVLNQVGGIDEFNNMDIWKKKAVAEALGISVGELKQMVANQENLNTTSGKLQQTWSMVNDYFRAAGDTLLGPLASGATFFLGELIKAKLTAAAINGEGFKGMMKSLNPFKKGGVAGAAGDAIKGKAGDAVKDKVGKSISTDATDNASGGMNKLSKINTTALIKAAGAMVLMAGALYITAKALQEFNTVEWESLAKAGVALVGLGLSMLALSSVLTPFIPVLYPMAAAFLAFGASLFLVGAGIKLFSDGVVSISGVLPTIVEPLSQLSQINFLPILGLAGALGVLSAALLAVSVAGIAALPVLAGLGAIAIGMGLMGGEEGGAGGEGQTSKTDELINEIKGLRADLASGKIAVYMDGKKVTSGVAKVVNTSSTNSYVPK